MGKHIGTGGLARGKILGRLAFYTWVIAGEDYLEPYPSAPLKRLTVCKSGIVNEMKYIACLHIPSACLTKLNIFMLIV